MLYFLSTPIGNLGDLSERAKEILAAAELVLAEDTRQAGKILAHLGLRKKTVSLHEHTGTAKIDWVVAQIKSGQEAVYLSDAGTPGLSDPGGKLAAAALASEVEISPVPGPSALTALISVAPFSCQNFIFLGYFPKKKGRQKMLATIEKAKMPIFFYESPHRIQKTVQLLADNLADYKILIGRELTKKFEQVIFADLSDKLAESVRPQGEFVFALVQKKKI